jgi:hypothetical protein
MEAPRIKKSIGYWQGSLDKQMISQNVDPASFETIAVRVVRACGSL